MASTPKIRDYFTKENPHGLPVHPRPQSREGKQDCMRGAVAGERTVDLNRCAVAVEGV
jgi:hypothetical protein